MFQLTVTSNAPQIARQLDRAIKRQVPFAVSNALNDMVVEIRDNEVRKEYEKTFELRNESFFKNLTHKVFFSNKRQVRRFGLLIASIQRSELPAPPGSVGRNINKDTSFMDLHVKGGIRKPLGAKKAVPMTVGGADIKRAKGTGKVVKSKQVKTLYPKDNTFVRNSRRTGKPILFQVKAKKEIPMYHFQPSVKNKKKYNPARAVKKGIEKRFKRHIQTGFVNALKTTKIFV
tara:strand:- start:43 stop:735 length:693 start_codon:yes stop_codon:yes gene_type:complete